MSDHNTHISFELRSSIRWSIRRALRRTSTALLGLPGLALSGATIAGPEGGDVIRGAADILRPDANTTTIDQHTDRAVINWQTFNVDADEYVLFNQLDSSSVVLNRVLSSDASYILGHMQANGQVFLLNPHGLFFGEGAVLDVQGFLGTTLDIGNDDFMAGNYRFTRANEAAALGQVVNHGTITAGDGGYVMLAGDFTENTGFISAMGGTAALVSGNALTLDIAGDGLVNFAVDEATLAEQAGVRNAGSIIADGGMVVMTARVAHDVTSTVVNNEGLMRARSIEERDGAIYLVGNGGHVEQSGTLDANGENADGGGIGIYSDRDVVLHDGGIQTATGDDNHKGGVIRAIAEDHLDYQVDNLMRTTGGAGGGFVEVSGHGSIALRGTPDVGAGGTFLIDPFSLTLTTGNNPPTGTGTGQVGVEYIEGLLNAGTNVSLVASNSIGASVGGLDISATSGSGDLFMGIGFISFGACSPFGDAGVCLNDPVSAGFSSVPDGSINLSGLTIDIAGGFAASASQGTISFGDITAGGDVAISATFDAAYGGGIVDIGDKITSTGGSITIEGGTSVTVGGLIAAGTVEINPSLTGDASIGASGISAANVDIQLENLTLNGDINATGEVYLWGINTLTMNSVNVHAQERNLIITSESTGALQLGDLTGSEVRVETDGADIVTGNINVNNENGRAHLRLMSTNFSNGGNITVNGDITVTGQAGGSRVSAALAEFNVLQGNSASVTVTGTTTLNGNNGPVVAMEGNSISGSLGGVFLNAETSNGNVTFGDIVANGSGIGNISISGNNVSIGDVDADIAGADFTRGFSVDCQEPCNINGTETVTDGGRFEMFLGNGGSNPSLTLGNVAITAPNARLNTAGSFGGGFANMSAGNISINATGGSYEYSSTGASYGGATIDYSENGVGGAADLVIGGRNTVDVNINGNISVTAQGMALIDIIADNVTVGDMSAVTTGGSVTRSGTRYVSGGRIGEEDGEFDGGPRITEGTVTGGSAIITVSGMTGDGTTIAAQSLDAGDISAEAKGAVFIGLLAEDISAGDVSGQATAGTREGTIDRTRTENGDEIHETGTVSGSYGEVEIAIEGVNSVELGNVSAQGPVAAGNISVNNGTLDMGNLTLTGTGMDIRVEETVENLTAGTTETFLIDGPALVTGMGIDAGGGIVMGDIDITGIGAAGILLSAPEIETGSVSIEVADGSYTVRDPNFFGGEETDFTVGNAVFAFNTLDGATVNGDFSMDVDGAAHVGSTFDVTGDVSIVAGRGFTVTVPETVQFLNNVREDHVDPDAINLGSPVNVSADNIVISTGGNANFANTVFAATGSVALDAGNNMNVSGISITAGGGVSLIAGGSIANGGAVGTITADALALVAERDISLGSTSLTVGDGSVTGFSGDTFLIDLLANEGLTTSGTTPSLYASGRTVTLGDIALAGDYMLMETTTLTFSGAVTTSSSNLIAQFAPLNTGASMGVENSATGTGDVNYTNLDHIGLFEGQTVVIGSTQSTGALEIGTTGTIDIGATNFFAITNGEVNGLDRVLSTGIVKDLQSLIGGGFDVPQSDEIDIYSDTFTNLDEAYGIRARGDDDDEGDEEGEDTADDTVEEEEDDSLIRRETAEEELMCE